MDVRGKIEADIKIGGVSIPASFIVIDKLGYEVIIGCDLLEQTRAIIDKKSNLLTLFDGLTSVKMTQTGHHEIVKTISTVIIPAQSEAIVPVTCANKPTKGNYIIEGYTGSSCKTLMVGRILINPKNIIYPCRVMNVTEKEIKLRPKTPLGILSAVTVENSNKIQQFNEKEAKITYEQKLTALNMEGISLSDSVMTGNDLTSLVELLYRNIDLFATNLDEMTGCKVLKHRIETGSNPPVRLRSYRQSPDDRAEISRQTNEMLKAGIITPSDTPYSSPVLLVSKDGSKRLVVDYRVLNSQTALISWKLPVFDEILDCISEKNRLCGVLWI